MNALTIIMLAFSVLGALDRIIGNKFGLGKEFERGFMLLGTMALSMIGMIAIAPVLADFLEPIFTFMNDKMHIEPSILPATLFANDMGGAPLSVEVAADKALGSFNALIVASMMGATVSFTIPFALGVVGHDRHRELLLGLLCGIVTVPLGCFVSGVVQGLPILKLILNLLPLLIFSIIIALGLLWKPNACVKIFEIFGVFIKALITVGLVFAVIKYLTGWEVLKGMATLEEGGIICLNASAVISGAFPLMFIVSKLLRKPLCALGKKIKIGEDAALGLLSTTVTSVTTFEMMNRMDKKGTLLNSAFAVSAAWTFGGHLAFTMAFDSSFVFSLIIGKLVAGLTSLLVAVFLYNRLYEINTCKSDTENV